MLNSIKFDTESKRLAWTFNHVDANKSHDTRVGVWSTETMSPAGDVLMGRYGYRDRIDFCSEPNRVLTYRTGISMWGIGLPTEFNEIDNQNDSEDWIVGDFPITQYCIRLGYSSDASVIYLLFPEEFPSHAQILQAFRRDKGVGRTLSFDSALLRHRHNHWEFPWSMNENVLSIADNVIDISNFDNTHVMNCIQLDSVETVVATAFHLDGSLMGCLQRTTSLSVLKLNSTQQGEEVACAERNFF